MKKYKIAIIKGDGIGPEIVDEAIKVLDALSVKEDFEFNYQEYLMGGSAYDVMGVPLPDVTIEGCKNSDAILFGAIGGEKWDNLPRELRPESGLLKLRKELKLTQADLAIKCNVSLTTIQLWEREVTTPSKENMIKLKKALEVVDQNG